jgi:hypothetical protein
MEMYSVSISVSKDANGKAITAQGAEKARLAGWQASEGPLGKGTFILKKDITYSAPANMDEVLTMPEAEVIKAIEQYNSKAAQNAERGKIYNIIGGKDTEIIKSIRTILAGVYGVDLNAFDATLDFDQRYSEEFWKEVLAAKK